MTEKHLTGAFIYEPAVTLPVGSILYREHLKLTDRSSITESAGYFMPTRYLSTAVECAAVRERAGVFDCTNMGVLEVMGAGSEEFLNAVTTNDVHSLREHTAQYSYILDAAGNILDDIIVYRREKDKYMVVVNAVNEPKVKAYLAAVQGGKATIDPASTDRRIARACIRDMRVIASGPDCRMNISLQGPASLEVLGMLGDEDVRKRAGILKDFEVFEGKLSGIRCIISRTGYTGAKVGFELFVHPESASKLWWRLLDAGKTLGILPCGLKAREALRVEAGLPLYGHELAGPYNISPFEAGYGWAVKLEKEFFIGKAAMKNISANYDMKVVRIELPVEKTAGPVQQDDAVISGDICIGWVLSGAIAGERQVGLAYVEKEKVAEGDCVGLYYLARSDDQKANGKKETVEKGEKVQADIEGKIVSRFERF